MTIPFVDPQTGKALELTDDGLCDGDRTVYPLVDGACRVVLGANYTDNFGFQWNEFDSTQLDSQSGVSLSRDRFFAETNWSADSLADKDVLEVGSGAGRFTEIVLQHTEANLCSVDYSNAVAANYRSNGPHDRLQLFQASIYEMPFAPQSFDRVFCLGVLQHTPDFRKSLQCLFEMVRPGGELVVDFYEIRGWWSKIQAKYMLRPVTRRMPASTLHTLIDRTADPLIAAAKLFSSVGVGRITNRFLPIVDLTTLPQELSRKELREWVVLDTLDMFSPRYDDPQRVSTVARWLSEAGADVTFAGSVAYGDGYRAAVVRARRLD